MLPRNGGEKNYLEYVYKHPRFMATCVYAVYGLFIVRHLLRISPVFSPAISNVHPSIPSSLANVRIPAPSQHPVLIIPRPPTRT